MIKPVYEFILWDNCRNNCSFCHLKKNKQLTIEEKIKSLNSVLSFLDSDEYVCGSHILLIGGELFDSPQINSQLNSFFDLVVQKMKNNEIELLYINTNLLYKNVDSLHYFLNLITENGLSERLRFTTSFDVKGRFANERLYNLFRKNLEVIKIKYPQVNIIANVILTKALCDYITKFTTEYPDVMFHEWEERVVGCHAMFIPYIVYDETLTPTKEELLRTLVTLKSIGYNVIPFINNMDIPQERKLYKFDGDKLNYCSANILKCGHSENFKLWSKSKHECFVCMVKELFDE